MITMLRLTKFSLVQITESETSYSKDAQASFDGNAVLDAGNTDVIKAGLNWALREAETKGLSKLHIHCSVECAREFIDDRNFRSMVLKDGIKLSSDGNTYIREVVYGQSINMCFTKEGRGNQSHGAMGATAEGQVPVDPAGSGVLNAGVQVITKCIGPGCGMHWKLQVCWPHMGLPPCIVERYLCWLHKLELSPGLPTAYSWAA